MKTDPTGGPAFRLENLSALAYANGFTLWHYQVTNPSTIKLQPRFFDAAEDMTKPGDLVIVSSPVGYPPEFIAIPPRTKESGHDD